MAHRCALAAVRWRVAAWAATLFVVCGPAAATPPTGSKPPTQQPASQSTPPATMSKDAKPKTPAAKLPDAKLERVSFAELPGWEDDDHLAAFKTFLKSCDAVMKASAKADGSKPAAQCKVPVGELASGCQAAQEVKSPTKAAAKAFFEKHFVPHRIAHQKPEGLLTGYYEPVLEGSRTQTAKFQTPVYRRPPDLVNVVAEADRAAKQTGFTHLRKTAGGEETPFPTRAEIEQGALAGQGLELLYLEDPVEVFFMHIQGSGRIHLTDGTTVRINYDGKNGHPYSSIGRYLIESGMLDANKVSMQALGKWLREDKARGQKVMWQNKSFIFFRELGESDGPMGAMQVVLTPGRSLAVDSGYHTLGTPIYLSVPQLTPGKRGPSFNRLMVAQDVGSAIRGPERGDIYFGSGDKAGKLAGTTKHAGNFFVLLPAVTQTAGEGIRFGEHLPWQAIVKGAQ